MKQEQSEPLAFTRLLQRPRARARPSDAFSLIREAVPA